jgi:phospholipid/cholesterol/gamma-HCH transport system permease protein
MIQPAIGAEAVERLNMSRSAQGVLTVGISGDWIIGGSTPSLDLIKTECGKGTPVTKIILSEEKLGRWDSSLLTFLIKVNDFCSEKKIDLNNDKLPDGVKRLLRLAFAVPERKGDRKEAGRPSFFYTIGDKTEGLWKSILGTLDFIGGASLAFARLFTGKAQFRKSDFLSAIQECGAEALPIVSLISLLVGLILAFVGSIQLRMFGAQIYIADLVAIAMARAMGAIMTGIIMAGRTGAAYAARIGTMQVNEEIDALRTAGISPMEFLVLPRILALALMMPLLALYSDLMGILGGLIVSVGGFGISFREYFNETKAALSLTNIGIGLFNAFVFGILIALAGCLRGMQCGRSASAVGDATTSAVVTGIVSIIIATAIITVLCNTLGI